MNRGKARFKPKSKKPPKVKYEETKAFRMFDLMMRQNRGIKGTT